ncbi:MAG: hypothetical protein JWM88_3500 [Verrucomicrobia bacterium]|nr:hypothetical protein [Verrucomicrobiota bacterium]
MKSPEIITRYFAAANRFDASGAAECFTADARVHDEGHEHVGQDAVRAWVAETGRKYQPRSAVIRAKVSGSKVALAVRISGRFPGSPIELDYDITLRDGKISMLDIT